MRRAVSSFLSSRSDGSATPRLTGNLVSRVFHSRPQATNAINGEAARLSNTFANSGILISARPLYAAYLHSCTVRNYATMQESSGYAVAHGAESPKKKSQATLMYLAALVIAMVGCSYASVPLYRKFCQATGYGGTVRRLETVEEKIARHAQDGTASTRSLVVQFNADIADGLPWKFTPTQREVRVKPGQSTLAFFTAENLSSKPITGVSTYNVTPMKAGSYFNKIQCFCFEEQRLLPGEKIDMPVFFYIDPEFATDPKMDNINNLILSYTFFKVEDGEPNTEE